MICETCGHATARFRCRDCGGDGGEWGTAEAGEDVWQRCVECAGIGTVERCIALVCASRKSSSMLTVGEARFVDAALAHLAAED